MKRNSWINFDIKILNCKNSMLLYPNYHRLFKILISTFIQNFFFSFSHYPHYNHRLFKILISTFFQEFFFNFPLPQLPPIFLKQNIFIYSIIFEFPSTSNFLKSNLHLFYNFFSISHYFIFKIGNITTLTTYL